MKNAYHLLLFTHMLTGLFVRFTHLVPALNAFNDINIILAPHRERVLRLTMRTHGTGNKTLAH